jgi:hypothetical protein
MIANRFRGAAWAGGLKVDVLDGVIAIGQATRNPRLVEPFIIKT